MSSSQEEAELSDSNPSMNMLPGLEERFSFRSLLFPDIPEPSKLSGFTVNICASALGRRSGRLCYNDSHLFRNVLGINMCLSVFIENNGLLQDC